LSSTLHAPQPAYIMLTVKTEIKIIGILLFIMFSFNKISYK
jgi:hypothetical protein